MTIQRSSGQSISFSQIRNEFGAGQNRIGQYRRDDPSFRYQNRGELSGLPLDNGIPTSGSISYSQFYQKKANAVVNCHGSGNSQYGFNARDQRFNTGQYVVVGGYRDSLNPNQWQGGKKIIIHVNKDYGSGGASSQNHTAFNVGQWPANSDVVLNVGTQGRIVGRGGNGAQGSTGGGGNDGKQGSSGLRQPSNPTAQGRSFNIQNNGLIAGGGGGGGGGAHAEQNDPPVDYNDADGASGGGGAGLPAGERGGNANGNEEGQDGNLIQGGQGGQGEDDSEAEGGNGGKGGDVGGGQQFGEFNGENGQGGSEGKNKEGNNGDGGEGGFATVGYTW